MVIQALSGHRPLPRGGIPARGLALRRSAAGIGPRQLARERAGRQAPTLVPGMFNIVCLFVFAYDILLPVLPPFIMFCDRRNTHVDLGRCNTFFVSTLTDSGG